MGGISKSQSKPPFCISGHAHWVNQMKCFSYWIEGYEWVLKWNSKKNIEKEKAPS